MKRIFLIGQCTLHWGRMEHGNLGNYAIIEPLIRELHRVFRDAEIVTTFQMSDEFNERERVTKLEMGLYYSWGRFDLLRAIYEVTASIIFRNHLPNFLSTQFIKEVRRSELVIDFSGDIWGENADLVGKHRFIVGLFKDLTAQFLGKKTAMIAGSPGPFNGSLTTQLARYVFAKFDLVTNRESVSTILLEKNNFSTKHTYSLACPAFLFQPAEEQEMREIYVHERIEESRPLVGFIVCGWNMTKGPFGLWPREDSEYYFFADAVEHIVRSYHCTVLLLSHNNGFIPPPNFRITEGRDHQILHQLYSVLEKRGTTENVRKLDGLYSMGQTKAIIGKLDMLISGRIHAAVSGFTQYIPTVVLDYGHEPKAHKLKGFTELAGMREYMADPSRRDDLLAKIDLCWQNRVSVKEHLIRTIPQVQEKARKNFDLLQPLLPFSSPSLYQRTGDH